MAYSISLLGEKDGFDKTITFTSSLTEKEIAEAYRNFVSRCDGVTRDHLPMRCPLKCSKGNNCYEVQFDDRNLRYNFDPFMTFIAEIIHEGLIKAAKLLDNGRFGATAYVITPGSCKKFEFFGNEDTLHKIHIGKVSFAEALTNEDGVSAAGYIKSLTK